MVVNRQIINLRRDCLYNILSSPFITYLPPATRAIHPAGQHRSMPRSGCTNSGQQAFFRHRPNERVLRVASTALIINSGVC